MKLKFASLFLFFTSLVVAQTCPVQVKGAGPDIPCNVKVNGVTLVPNVAVNIPAYNGNYNQAHIEFDTNAPSTTAACIDYNVNGYSAPTCQRIEHDDTFVTHHSIVADNFMPGKATAINVASLGQAGSGSGSWFGVLGDRFSSAWSVAPSGNQQASAYQVKMAMPPAGAPQWKAYVKGPPVLDQGHAMFLDILPILQSGSIPNYVGAMDIKIDGQECAAAIPASCAGFKTLLADSGSERTSSVPYGNYGASVSHTGAMAGKFLVAGVGSYGFSQPGLLWFIEATTAATGHHAADISLSGVDSTQTPIGNTVNLHYEFDVVSVPAFHIVTPSSFPAFNSLGSYLAAIAPGIRGIPEQHLSFGFEYSKSKSLTAPGIYPNDNYSTTQTAFPPFDVTNYNGAVICADMAKWSQQVVSSGATFLGNHAYRLGDTFTDGTSAFVVQVAGTSGTTLNAGSTKAGDLITSGGVTVANDGNPGYWYAMFQRLSQPAKEWMTAALPHTVQEEWNAMNERDVFMDLMIEGNTTNDNCDGSGHCVGLALKGMKYGAYPFVPAPHGMALTAQPLTWSGKFVGNGTWRAGPYYTELLDNLYVATGSKVMNGGFPAADRRLDIAIQALREAENYNPVVSAANPYPAAISTPSFDVGLYFEMMVNHCVVQIHQGEQCDGRIPVEMGKFIDWFLVTEFNKSGHDYSSPYTLWFIPVGPRNDHTGHDNTNFAANAQLNMLMAPFVAWYCAAAGDPTFPQSGVECWQAADTMAQHALDPGFWNSKSWNQVFKGWWNFINWRTGARPVTWIDTISDDNRLPAPLPDSLEGFASGEWSRPSYTTGAGGQVTWTWNTFKKLVNTWVMWGPAGNLSNRVDCGPNTFVGPDTTWSKSCSASGLANGIYDMGFGGLDESGNTSFTSYCVTCNGATNWNFTITQGGSGPPPLSIATASPLPAATVGSDYRAQLVANGGTLPYSWTETGTLPSGLQMDPTGLIAGNPTAAGTAQFTATVKDSGVPTPQTQSRNFALTINPQQVINPVQVPKQTLKAGTVGLPYNQPITVTGGIAPYSCSAAGILPAGLKVVGCAVQGSPSAVGTFAFGVKACDAETPVKCGIGTVTLTIAQGCQLSIVSIPLPPAVQHKSYSAKLTVKCSSVGTVLKWQVVSGALPAGITLNPATGQLVATSVTDKPGTYTTIVQVQGMSGPPAKTTITIIVKPGSSIGG